MRAKDSDVFYVANTTGFLAMGDGTEFAFRAGYTRIKGDHEARRRAPNLFERWDPSVTYDADGHRYAPQ